MPEFLLQEDRPTVEATQTTCGVFILYEKERSHVAYVACERPVEVVE